MIALLDSGIGGLPYLAAIRALLPSERFAYLADTAHFPYGNRPASEIVGLVHVAVEHLTRAVAPRAVVIACNTASVVSLVELRARFDIPFIGVVPAVKPAAAMTRNGRIGILATERTASDGYLQELITRFASNLSVTTVAAPGLVEAIEKAPDSRDGIEAALADPVDRLRRRDVDTVVLGCTHFIHARHHIEKLIGPAVQVVDSVSGVARQTARVCDGELNETQIGPGNSLLMTTADPTEAYAVLARRFNLELDHARRHGPVR